jgi:hypothetical protein
LWVNRLFRFHVEMKKQFGFEVAIEVTPPPERPEFLLELTHSGNLDKTRDCFD